MSEKCEESVSIPVYWLKYRRSFTHTGTGFHILGMAFLLAHLLVFLIFAYSYHDFLLVIYSLQYDSGLVPHSQAPSKLALSLHVIRVLRSLSCGTPIISTVARKGTVGLVDKLVP